MGVTAVGGRRDSWHYPTQWAVDNTKAQGFVLFGPASGVPPDPNVLALQSPCHLSLTGLPWTRSTDPWPPRRLQSSQFCGFSGASSLSTGLHCI